MAITAQESTFELVSEGVHDAMLMGWEETTGGLYGPGIKFIWNLVNLPDKANGEPADIWQFTSQKLTPKSNLWPLLKTLGAKFDLGDTFEAAELLDPLVGTMATLVVKHEPGKNGDRAKVTDVLAFKGKK